MFHEGRENSRLIKKIEIDSLSYEPVKILFLKLYLFIKTVWCLVNALLMGTVLYPRLAKP